MLQMGNGGVDFSIENMSHFDNYENHHPPPSKNRVFSAPKHPLDLRPVCKLKFVRCGPVEKDQSTLSVLAYSWWSKIKDAFFKKTV